jgi:hypothetical protein
MSDERQLAAIAGQRQTARLPENNPVSRNVECVLHACVDHLPADEVDVHRSGPVRHERVPRAEDRVRQRTVNALTDRRAIVVVVRRQSDRPSAGEGDVEWAGAVRAGQDLRVVDLDELNGWRLCSGCRRLTQKRCRRPCRRRHVPLTSTLLVRPAWTRTRDQRIMSPARRAATSATRRESVQPSG